MLATAGAYALVARFTAPWHVLAWVGLVPWLAALDRTPALRGTLALALALCVVFVVAVFGWFAPAIASYTGAPWMVGIGVLAVAAPLLEPQFLTTALVRRRVRQRRDGFAVMALASAGVYVGTEWLVPKLFGDTLGYGLFPAGWLRQGADLGGVPALTFVLVVANEGVWRVVRDGWRSAAAPAVCVAVLVGALSGYGALRVHQLAAATPGIRPLSAGVVQAGLSKYDRLATEIGTYAAVRTILDAHYALSGEALTHDPDVLVWPETVYPTTFGTPKSPDGAAFDREIAGWVARTGRALVFGSYDAEDGHEYNAAVFLEPSRDGRLVFDTYRKAALFPFIEYVPRVVDNAFVRHLLPWLGTWTPGNGAHVLPLRLRDGRTLRVAPLICYDVLAPGLARAAVRQGAELILTLSNDSWFAAGAGPWFHFVAAAFRSIETRRPQIRATNTGISAAIAPSGDVLVRADVDTRAALLATVTPVAAAPPLAVLVGDWTGPGALAIGVLAAFAARRQGGIRSG